MKVINNDLVIVRGGGDLATGIIQKLFRAGFHVVVLETKAPLAIRRTVALCDCVYEGTKVVEDMKARLVTDEPGIRNSLAAGEIPFLTDPSGEWIHKLKPGYVVDAIIAKRNLGTTKDMAPAVIGVGPGFTAGLDVDIVIETMRGHDLGRLLFKGTALPNTGIPGEIGGKSAERVIHAPAAGVVVHHSGIGDKVCRGDILMEINGEGVPSPLDGLLRGLIRAGTLVPKGMKIGDVDPRTDVDFLTISDKARAIGGGVLEGILYLRKKMR